MIEKMVGKMVGKKFYVYDEKCKHYKKDANGRSFGGPIYRKSWRIREVVSETDRSWIDNYGTKWNKKEFNQPMNEKDLDQLCWVHDNAYPISEKVRRIDDFDLLTKISDLIKEG